MDKGHKDRHGMANDSKLFLSVTDKDIVTVRPRRRVPDSFQQRMEIIGDERIHLTHFVLFCFVISNLFFSSCLLSGEHMKGRTRTHMRLLSICRTQVLAGHDFKSLKPQCFEVEFEQRHLFTFLLL